MMKRRAIATIVTTSHLPWARVLALSMRRVSLQVPVFACIVDRAAAKPGGAAEPFTVLGAESLGIEGWRRVAFQYTAFELCCALKPVVLRHLLGSMDFDEVLYLDADMWVLRPPEAVWEALRTCDILLSPHRIRARDADGAEDGLLRSGVYNGGLIGVRAVATAYDFLRWWTARTRTECIVDLAGDRFVDQRWLDIVPTLFEAVSVLRHPGYNVAYWNLEDRPLTRDSDGPAAVGEPLSLFHFSGFDPRNPKTLTQHSSEPSPPSDGVISELLNRYASELRDAGWRAESENRYGFGCFADGTAIEPLWRDMLRAGLPALSDAEDPFDPTWIPVFQRHAPDFAWCRTDDQIRRTREQLTCAQDRIRQLEELLAKSRARRREVAARFDRAARNVKRYRTTFVDVNRSFLMRNYLRAIRRLRRLGSRRRWKALRSRHGRRLLLSAARNALYLHTLRARQTLRRGRRRPMVALSLVVSMGDIVACEPLVRLVRRQWPDACLVFCVARLYRELLDAHPDVDRTIAVECVSEWMWLRGLRVFDHVVDMNFHLRGCGTCESQLLKSQGDNGVTFLNYYELGNLLEVHARSAGLHVAAESPRVYIGKAAERVVDVLALPRDFVCIHAKANEEQRDYPPEKWRQVVAHINERWRVPVVEVGTTSVAVRDAAAGNRDLCGRLSILESAEVIRRASLFIGIDSGPAHLANAVAVPGIVLLGHYLKFKRYLPYSGPYAAAEVADLLRHDGLVAELGVARVCDAVDARLGRILGATR